MTNGLRKRSRGGLQFGRSGVPGRTAWTTRELTNEVWEVRPTTWGQQCVEALEQRLSSCETQEIRADGPDCPCR